MTMWVDKRGHYQIETSPVICGAKQVNNYSTFY